ncbi:hypothetical protein OS965_25495 [Streptomyces sp. H27-G5]|uniref:hypothetical protein n=1 Tax=Streptomyces sp. H27-G5 TaxID=2996698 RepID=UPI0022706103|nr:hypothetical protein [Streptomyces sp. H27-G5]MCY0921503.1 hypothetical protein [Streptomyces sp. H27-G5]
MNPSAHINHHAVLRARVALLGSGKPPLGERVAAYRVLAQVSPLAYLPLLAVALGKYARREFADRPDIALALHMESVAAARRMCALEPERVELLVHSLTLYREQLIHMDRQEEVRTVEKELTTLFQADQR